MAGGCITDTISVHEGTGNLVCLVKLLNFWLSLLLVSGLIEVGWLSRRKRRNREDQYVCRGKVAVTVRGSTYHIGNLVVGCVLSCSLLAGHVSCVHCLVGLCELSERGKRVRAKL